MERPYHFGPVPIRPDRGTKNLKRIGPHVDEIVNVLALAIRKELTAKDLKTTIIAYPMGASDIGCMF